MPRSHTPAKDLRAINVLVIDDQPEFASFAKEVAELCGYTAHALTDPTIFKEHCAAIKPRAVILDIQMPHVDGMRLTQWLGEFVHEAKLDMRLIIVSGRGTSTIQLCKSVAAITGLSDVHAFNKPIEVATLTKALANL